MDEINRQLPVVAVKRLLADLEKQGLTVSKERILRILCACDVPAAVQVLDLWERPEVAVSHWVLLMTGINQQDELEIARNLLSWKTFSAKDSARVLCLQGSERVGFKLCVNTFGVTDWPTLVFGDSPEMYSFLRVGPQLLRSFSACPGSFERFLTTIHVMAENGAAFRDIEKLLMKEHFWNGLKLIYDEIKSFFSFSVQAKV